jgi:type II restriction/modification system DNA methylase subunit YeeA
VSEKLLPLQASGNIVCANATRVDWEEVCPKEAECKTYILGNPPYLGFNMQSEEQKEDMKTIYPFPDNMKFLDYIVCWFFKATYYIDQNSQAAFVTTNSVCQGTQVPMIWPEIFSKNIEINFTYPEFAWSNNAKKNAGVICSIIGLRKITTKPKFIYSS